MRDPDCRIHVDSNYVSVLLLLGFSEVRGHGMRFSNIVHYAPSRATRIENTTQYIPRTPTSRVRRRALSPSYLDLSSRAKSIR